MATNYTKNSVTVTTTSKASTSRYGTATYGAWMYALGPLPAYVSRNTVVVTNRAKS